MEIKIKRLDKTMDLPSYIHKGDAAIDLRSSEEFVLKKKMQKVVKTGIKVAIPEGYAGLIWDRSGLAAKNSLHVLAGVVDSGYRGEIGVVIINLGEEDFKIEKNMRIAQMIIQPVANANITEVDELDETHRNEKGFGSSGHK